jgi:hypothetical protein
MLDQLGIDAKWLFGVFGVLIVGAFKYTHAKIAGLESMFKSNQIHVGETHKSENDKLWDAMERHRVEFGNFKDRVLRENVTKDDLHETEKRLTTAIERVSQR